MKLVDVDEKKFYEFINKHNLKKVQATYFHSYNYINEKGDVMAYYESSSWSTERIYQILAEDNFETLNLVNNIINEKS